MDTERPRLCSGGVFCVYGERRVPSLGSLASDFLQLRRQPVHFPEFPLCFALPAVGLLGSFTFPRGRQLTAQSLQALYLPLHRCLPFGRSDRLSFKVGDRPGSWGRRSVFIERGHSPGRRYTPFTGGCGVCLGSSGRFDVIMVRIFDDYRFRGGRGCRKNNGTENRDIHWCTRQLYETMSTALCSPICTVTGWGYPVPMIGAAQYPEQPGLVSQLENVLR